MTKHKASRTARSTLHVINDVGRHSEANWRRHWGPRTQGAISSDPMHVKNSPRVHLANAKLRSMSLQMTFLHRTSKSAFRAWWGGCAVHLGSTCCRGHLRTPRTRAIKDSHVLGASGHGRKEALMILPGEA